MDEQDWKLENEWLERVLTEARRQHAQNGASSDRLREDALETQKELWENVGSVSGGSDLNHIADFLGYIDAMKRQKRSHAQFEAMRLKYERMLNAPYFGKIDFQKTGDAAAQSRYIGLANLIGAQNEVLVCDWRAPVSGMFYDFETGDAFYECPNGIVRGLLTGKRQFKIDAGKIDYMFDSSLKIDDEILQQILSRSTENRMKAIVTSIQREQNKAIRNEDDKNLLVQGPAGSGKTSIALHRAAYLLYKHRDTISARNIIVFSPNSLFNDYISDVLPELGEENIQQTTLSDYLQSELPANLKKENPNDMMEYILTAGSWAGYARRSAGIRFKSSRLFLDALERYAEYVINLEPRFFDIVLNDSMVFSAAELGELYAGEYCAFPIKRRFEKVRAYALNLLKRRVNARVRELAAALDTEGGSLDRNELRRKAAAIVHKETEGLHAMIDRMTAFDLTALYRRFFEQLSQFTEGWDEAELAAIAQDSIANLEAGQLFYEDQAPLYYLSGCLAGFAKTADIKCVIIDEAQDYTPLQFKLFGKLFGGARMTILGDPEQAINPFMNSGSNKNLSEGFPIADTQFVKLTKSYRSTAEITAFARRLLGDEPQGETVERHGEEPLLRAFADEHAINGQIMADVNEFQQKGYRSVGILTRTRREAQEMIHAFKGKAGVRAIIDGDEGFTSGVLVMPVYLAKGLEFDAVIISNAGGGNYFGEQERHLLYTACTRALHALRVYSVGEPTALLRLPDKSVQ